MTQDIKQSVVSFTCLPDIRESISEVMRHFEDALNDKYDASEDAEKFLDAWLQMQKQQGLRLFWRRRQSESSNLSLKDSK